MNLPDIIRKTIFVAALFTGLLIAPVGLSGSKAYASCSDVPPSQCCGSGDSAVTTSIDLGCKAKGNPIMDALFAIIRFLSIGVGLVIIGSLVVAGIQFTSSRGDPQGSANALKRVQSTFIALLLFLFTYAILNYIVPGQLLQ